MRFWIKLYYATGLRRLLNRLQRRVAGEHKMKRSPLLDFDSPGALVAYIGKRFEWRKDSTRLGGLVIPLDYSTEPEVFQALLADGVKEREGDCDDFHTWAAHTLLRVPGVEQALLLSCVWRGGGHTTCVYQYKGDWYLLNYRIDGPIESPQAAPRMVFDWASAKREVPVRPRFWVLETPELRLIETG